MKSQSVIYILPLNKFILFLIGETHPKLGESDSLNRITSISGSEEDPCVLQLPIGVRWKCVAWKDIIYIGCETFNLFINNKLILLVK